MNEESGAVLGLKWDGTISAGPLVAAIAIIVPIIGSAYLLRAQVEAIETKVDVSFSKVEDRLQGVEDAVMQLRLENAKRDGMSSDIADLKAAVKELQSRG